MSLKKIIAAVFTACMMMTALPLTSLADSTGWYKTDSGWKYYTYEDGFIRKDWKKIGGVWYYFDYDGIMMSGIENYKIGDKYYSFSSSGACINPQGKSSPENGWFRYSLRYYTDYYDEETGRWNWKMKVFDYWQYYVDGSHYEGWKSIGGKWYYFSSCSGDMYTGDWWVEEDDAYYYFADSGEMITGWYFDGKDWFYARNNGTLIQDDWLLSGGKWYYFNYDRKMVSNSKNVNIDGKEYSFDSNGICINPDGKIAEQITGWYMSGNEYGRNNWYYFDSDGSKHKGWLKLNDNWYCFNEATGIMLTGIDYYGYSQYYFDENGVMKTGWIRVKEGNISYWIYADPTGVLYNNRWLNSGGKWYYFDYDCHMAAGVENLMIDGVDYSFDSNGSCTNPDAASVKITGWHKRCDYYDYYSQSNNYSWFYYGPDGVMYKEKWLLSGGNWYYFDSYGFMCRSTQFIDGKYYDFDSNGVCLNPNNPREHDDFYQS